MPLLRKIALSVAVFLAFSLGAQSPLSNETLHYDVVYHWGLIWKHAASATLSLKATSGCYKAALAARTISWADKIYPVRDTLKCTISRDVLPLHYEKISHEDDFYGRDVVDFVHSEKGSVGKCVVHRKTYSRDTTLYSSHHAYDMLSVFYYLRTLDFAGMKTGATVEIPIFSGRMQERLLIRFEGIDNIKLRDKTPHRAYHVKFKFSQDGRKKSSDDIDAWISMNPKHIPLMIRGKLPIGDMRVYYNSK